MMDDDDDDQITLTVCDSGFFLVHPDLSQDSGDTKTFIHSVGFRQTGVLLCAENISENK